MYHSFFWKHLNRPTQLLKQSIFVKERYEQLQIDYEIATNGLGRKYEKKKDKEKRYAMIDINL